jgi:hypothetical protein
MRIPGDIGKAGRAFLRGIDAWLTAERWELEPHELVVLFNGARQVDRLAAIAAALAELEPASMEWRLLVREERPCAIQVRQALLTLGLPMGPQADKSAARPAGRRRDREPMSRTESGRKAAAARWGTGATA